jgi:DNA-binding transcriptional regulator YhcF (GntR family)
MSPRAQRVQPLHRQIYDWFAARIAGGAPGFAPGDKLPPVRETARIWDVGYQAAQHAYELLASAKMVESRGKTGTFVLAPRNILGPQQRQHAPRVPAAERIEVTAAELIPAPAYIIPILNLPQVPRPQVIRREWVTSDSTGPFMLNVSWTAARFAQAAPELLELVPLPDGLTAAHLAAQLLGTELDWGRASREARQVKEDGREDALLGPGAHCLAEVYVWGAGDTVYEYGEFIVAEGRVVESDMEP